MIFIFVIYITKFHIAYGPKVADIKMDTVVLKDSWCIMKYVAFWVTNPCRITRKVKQTKMYVCTLEEFILVDLDTLLCKLELICIGNAVVYIQSQQWMRKDEINS